QDGEALVEAAVVAEEEAVIREVGDVVGLEGDGAAVGVRGQLQLTHVVGGGTQRGLPLGEAGERGRGRIEGGLRSVPVLLAQEEAAEEELGLSRRLRLGGQGLESGGRGRGI